MQTIQLNIVRKTSPLYKKYSALVDDNDYPMLSQYRWSVMLAGNKVYAKTIIDGVTVLMHTAITGYKMSDHKDGNGLNNQRNNLRECTQQQNQMNSNGAKNSSSKYKGVELRKQKYKDKVYTYWRATIMHNYTPIRLGHFKTEDEAGLAYNAKAKELFGEFARLNAVGGTT